MTITNPSRPHTTARRRKASSSQPRFVVIEGLSCVGKTTIAPMLAEAIGAQFLETLGPDLQPLRRWVDCEGSPSARLHFWLLADYMAAERIKQVLHAGTSVVIESYFYRTLATHAATGALALPAIDWHGAVLPDYALLLTVDEQVRQQRLSQRAQAGQQSRWSHLVEANLARTLQMYEWFGLRQFDTTGLNPRQVIAGLLAMLDDATAHIRDAHENRQG